MSKIAHPSVTRSISLEELSSSELISLCDHTFLLPPEAFTAGEGQGAVRQRREALDAFLKGVLQAPTLPYALCVRTEDVAYVRRITAGRLIIAATVGFPDGPRHSTAVKVVQAKMACAEGAQEVDMVCNYEALQREDWEHFLEDVTCVCDAVVAVGGRLKVILETSELSIEQTQAACELLAKTDVHFVKSSTGFSGTGATAEHLAVMRKYFPRGLKISGGVRKHTVRKLLAAAYNTGMIPLDPQTIRIGESGLLDELKNG